MKTVAIREFLIRNTLPDLAALYNDSMEVQVNVAKDNGEPIVMGDFRGKGTRGFTDNIETWKPIRIPFNAKSDPIFNDGPIGFNLDSHAEGVGLTGWNWRDKTSPYVAFDFDAIVGHSDKHAKKLTEDQLEEVKSKLTEFDFVSIRKSTSGRGLHVYVYLEPVATSNHTEHAALARSVLSLMSAKVGYDFNMSVDVAGGIIWIWHRKMKGTDGLTEIKKATGKLKVPLNWKDHIPVITRKATRTTPQFIEDNPNRDKLFDEICGYRNRNSLNKEHRRLIDFLEKSTAVWWWDSDNNMLVTHTIHLKEAHSALGLKGSFDTISTGEDRGADHNCFLYPRSGGAWSVRRFTQGTAEHPSWEQDGKGWTKCEYNADPDLKALSRINGAMEHKKGGQLFNEAKDAIKVLKDLGIQVDELPASILERRCIVEQIKGEQKLLVKIEHDAKDNPEKMKGWYEEAKNWNKVFKMFYTSNNSEIEADDHDEIIRHVATATGEDMGWIIFRDGRWCEEPLTHVKVFLASLGYDNKAITQILGKAITTAWTIVNKPFEPEYPGNREWNRGAAQFNFVPTSNTDNLSFPTWEKVLNHCGAGLNDAIKQHQWCKENGVLNGSDYLKLWVACMFQKPEEPAPYLALYSNEQDNGKSTFHEALSMLFDNGTMSGDLALTSEANFNGELRYAILCTVEETDMRKDKRAYNRLKDWATSPYITMHVKGETPYRIKNKTHWIQTSNEFAACPIFPGDTRITLIKVEPLDKTSIIPKRDLMVMLKKEAPDFLAEVLNMEIPYIKDRLILPVIVTDEKLHAEEMNMNYLEVFLKKECFYIPGQNVVVAEFYEKFISWLPAMEKGKWSKQLVGQRMPDRHPSGKLTTGNQQCYGNLSFNPDAPIGKPYKRDGAFLRCEL